MFLNAYGRIVVSILTFSQESKNGSLTKNKIAVFGIFLSFRYILFVFNTVYTYIAQLSLDIRIYEVSQETHCITYSLYMTISDISATHVWVFMYVEHIFCMHMNTYLADYLYTVVPTAQSHNCFTRFNVWLKTSIPVMASTTIMSYIYVTIGMKDYQHNIGGTFTWRLFGNMKDIARSNVTLASLKGDNVYRVWA